MKNFEFLKLGSKNILAHKAFSIFVTLTLGIIFGISAAITLHAISENQKKISEESAVTDGKVLASVRLCDSGYFSGGCDVPEKYDKEIAKVARKYSGEAIGAKITYINEKKEKVYVILERAGKYLNQGRSYYISEGKIPVLKKSGEKIDENIYQSYQEYTNDETPFYIMMDDTMTVINFLVMGGFQMENYEPLVIFDSEDDAYTFYANESNLNINQIFNKSIIAKKNFNESLKVAIKTVFLILGIAIIILAVFIILVSKNEKKNISLYRTFGATKADIIKIYLYSGIEILALSILISPIIYLITNIIL